MYNIYKKLLFLLILSMIFHCKKDSQKIADTNVSGVYLIKSTMVLNLLYALGKIEESKYIHFACFKIEEKEDKVLIKFPFLKEDFEYLIQENVESKEKESLKSYKLNIRKQSFDFSINKKFSIGFNYSAYSDALQHDFRSNKKFESIDQCLNSDIEMDQICLSERKRDVFYVSPFNGLHLREQPSVNSKSIRLLSQNTKFIFDPMTGEKISDSVDGKHGYWYKVEIGEDHGYLFSNFVNNYPICYSSKISLEKLIPYLVKFADLRFGTSGNGWLGVGISNDEQIWECNTLADASHCKFDSYEIGDKQLFMNYTYIENWKGGDRTWKKECQVDKEDFLHISPKNHYLELEKCDVVEM